LRSLGRSVAYPLKEQPVRKQFAAAGTMGAREVIVLGPSEVQRGVAITRDMSSGEEREVALDVLERGGVQ
jgi:histidyl-tRNA synthetase